MAGDVAIKRDPVAHQKGRCEICAHANSRHNDSGYCQVFYPSRREYCLCDGTDSWSGTVQTPSERETLERIAAVMGAARELIEATTEGGTQ